MSNNRSVPQTVAEDPWAKDIKALGLDRDELPVERALGLLRCVESDSFKFKMELKQQPQTRRGVLSTTSSVWDPLGFRSPVTLSAKMRQQELCGGNCGCVDATPPDILQQWEVWLQEVKLLSSFKAQRCLRPKHFGDPILGEISNPFAMEASWHQRQSGRCCIPGDGGFLFSGK